MNFYLLIRNFPYVAFAAIATGIAAVVTVIEKLIKGGYFLWLWRHPPQHDAHGTPLSYKLDSTDDSFDKLIDPTDDDLDPVGDLMTKPTAYERKKRVSEIQENPKEDV